MIYLYGRINGISTCKKWDTTTLICGIPIVYSCFGTVRFPKVLFIP